MYRKGDAMSSRNKLFVTIALVIAYVSFLALDILGRYGASTRIKYACIVGLALCALFRALSVKEGLSERLTAAALIFTCAADWFLLVKASSANMIPGVALFIPVQILYAARLVGTGGFSWKVAVPVRLAAALAGGIAGALVGDGQLLTVLVGIYFSQLVVSAVLETLRPREKWFALGLWLFVCCDVCVGLNYMPELLQEKLWGVISLGMWFFYLPSQYLIVFSAGEKRERKKAAKQENEGSDGNA